MPSFDNAVRKLEPPAQPSFRQAPHNVEAEQALLGAILVNNEAFYRVSDFLLPEHFFDPLHRKIFETTSSLIRGGKVATPVTLKTFLGPDQDIGGLTISQYLARLAAEATTVINAADYGQSIYDLAIRRALILVGEDVVNIAYDAPVDMAPSDQIEDAERRLYELAETGRYEGGFARFADALKDAIDMASAAFQRDGHLSGLATGLDDLDRVMGGMQPSDLIILAGRPGMGKTSLATNVAFHVAKHYRAEVQPDGTPKTIDGGSVGFFSLEMSAEQLATRVIAEQASVPSYKIRRGDLTEEEFTRLVVASQEMQAIPLYIDDTGGLSISQLTARARRLKRQRGLDLLVVDYIQLLQGSATEVGEPRAGDHGDHHRPEGARQGAQRPDHRPVPALPTGGEPRRQAPAALGPARVRIDRAGRRRRHVRLPRGVLREEQEAEGRHARSSSSGRPRWKRWPAGPRSSSASSATARPAPSRFSSTRTSRASAISREPTICPSGCEANAPWPHMGGRRLPLSVIPGEDRRSEGRG